jgi:hypothetical protein
MSHGLACAAACNVAHCLGLGTCQEPTSTYPARAAPRTVSHPTGTGRRHPVPLQCSSRHGLPARRPATVRPFNAPSGMAGLSSGMQRCTLSGSGNMSGTHQHIPGPRGAPHGVSSHGRGGISSPAGSAYEGEGHASMRQAAISQSTMHNAPLPHPCACAQRTACKLQAAAFVHGVRGHNAWPTPWPRAFKTGRWPWLRVNPTRVITEIAHIGNRVN